MSYDAIVVGAGSAGGILASRLSEDPRRSVLLLEAGPDYPSLEMLPDKLRRGYITAADILPSDHDWGFVGRGNAGAGSMAVWRGKVTGGSSAINGEIFLRGIPEDFNAWAAAGNPAWSFEEVLPFYRKIERDLDYPGPAHGSDGPIPVRRWRRDEWLASQVAFHTACLDAGFADSPDLNAPDAEGVGAIPLNTIDGVRWSTCLGYLNPARRRRNLTIWSESRAVRVLFDGCRATGVVVQRGAERATVRGDLIVLSAGAVGSPHLLMLSGVGPSDQLQAVEIPVAVDLPGVGQNLRDHPHVYATWQPRPGHRLDPERPRYQVALRCSTAGSSPRNDLQILMVSFATSRVDRGGDGVTPVGITMQPVLNLAVGSGELRLQSVDPDVQPSIDFNFLAEPFDRQRLREALRLCLRLAEHLAFEEILGPRLAPADDDFASDEALDIWMRREVTHTNHISGTCKMGPTSDPLAVVDQSGRVHGTEHLRIADASIMPDCVRANTNATSMMIGERLAALIQPG